MDFKKLNLVRVYFILAGYLPNFINYKIPIILRIFTFFRNQKSIQNINLKKINFYISDNCNYFFRKRKIMIQDKQNNLFIHFFLNSYFQNYKKFRNQISLKINSQYFSTPKYSLVHNVLNFLFIIEEKVSGQALNKAGNTVVERFLDIFFKINFLKVSLKKTKKEQLVYFELKKSFDRIINVLGKNSQLFELYRRCNSPFEQKIGFWPTSLNHGQILPVNVLYNKIYDKYYVIDYEPESMGYGPYAYDYCFFILYGSSLLSTNYKFRLKKKISKIFKNKKYQKAFLSQILWWARNKSLNTKQITKINKRSKIALTYF